MSCVNYFLKHVLPFFILINIVSILKIIIKKFDIKFQYKTGQGTSLFDKYPFKIVLYLLVASIGNKSSQYIRYTM